MLSIKQTWVHYTNLGSPTSHGHNSNREELCDVPHTTGNDMTSTIHLGYFP
jgi:hypothetical protein